MPALGRRLNIALLWLGCIFLNAQTGSPSVESMRAALPSLQGKQRLATLLELANSIESRMPQEALGYATEGVALAIKEGDKEKEAAFLSTAAFCCSQTGDFSMAIEYGKKALALGTELGNKERMARAHNTLGIAYTYIGAYSQALEESFQALHIREELGNETAITQSLNLVGIVYHHSGQYEKAIDHFNQILKRTERKPDTKRLILTKLNIGFAQYKLGRLNEALKVHQEALALSQESKETTYLPYAYLNLGLTFSDLRKFEKANEYLQLAYAKYREQNQKHGLVQVLNAMARMHMLSGHFARGIPLAKAGADIAKTINARDELKNSYELISDLYGKLGNVVESYRYYKLAVEIKDSIYTVQESNKIAEASMKIVTIKKDNEIEALKKEKVISELKIEKQRYSSLIFGSSVVFLVTIIFILGNYNKKIQQNKKSLEKSNLDLEAINAELQEKIREIKTLSGLLPICAQCKKIRNDKGYWTQLEGYISERTTATFSHGICPQCAEDLYPSAMKRVRAEGATPKPSME